MNEQSMRFRIGLFVLIALVLLAVLILLFTGAPGSSLFRGQDRYVFTFDSALGITPGTPVRRSGVRIGQVEKVALDDTTGRVKVTVAIDRPHVLYQDDTPTVVHGGLTGDTYIEIVSSSGNEPQPAEQPPVPPDRERSEVLPALYEVAQLPAEKPGGPPPQRVPAKPGTEFRGVSQADISSLVRELSGLVAPARRAFDEMTRTLESYQHLTPLMQQTLQDYRELAKETGQLIPPYRELAKTAQAMLPEIRRTNDEVQVAARNFARLNERLDVLVQTNQDKLVKALDNFNTTLTRVGNTFNEENQRNLAATLRNTSAGTRNLESIARNTEDLVKESRQTVRRVNDELTETDQVIKNMQQATKPFAGRSETISRNLEEGSINFNRTFSGLNGMVGSYNRSDGTLQRLLNDPSLYNNLNEAACMLTRLMPRLDRVLKDLEVFADKIARHPEALGLGGAVRPSSGLKEAPSSTSFRPYFPEH